MSVNGATPVDDGKDYQWWVPITFTSPGGDFEKTYSEIWLKPNENKKKISDLPNRNKAVIFNVKETGYYRVNYDRKNWELLVKQLNEDHESIDLVNRAQIIDDAFNLAKAGRLDYDVALGVTSYLHQEKEFTCWKAALSGFSYISQMLQRSGAYGEFRVIIFVMQFNQ